MEDEKDGVLDPEDTSPREEPEDPKDNEVYEERKWTPDMDSLLSTYIDEERHIESIHRCINKAFDGVNFTLQDIIDRRSYHTTDRSSTSQIITYLSEGRTVREVANRFKLSLRETEELLDRGFTGYDLWPIQDSNGKARYILLPQLEKPLALAPRIWKLQLQPAGQPWIWIRFPETSWDLIKIVPLSDVHYGSTGFLEDKFLGYIEWIANTPNAFTFINGDLIENALRDSVGGAIYEAKKMPNTQINEMIDILRPIAHKILWAIPGNHEDRTRKLAGFDPLEVICKVLDIPFFNDSINATVWWGEHQWEFYAKHGNTNSATKGGKLNAAKKPQDQMEYIHFYIMGHVHDAMTNKIDKHVRNFKTFELEQKPQYIIICGSFHGYWGTYASKAGMSPSSGGAPTCIIYRNGDFKANIW